MAAKRGRQFPAATAEVEYEPDIPNSAYSFLEPANPRTPSTPVKPSNKERFTINNLNRDDNAYGYKDSHELLPSKYAEYTYSTGTSDKHGQEEGIKALVNSPRARRHDEAQYWDPGALFSYTPSTLGGLYSSRGATHRVGAVLGALHNINQKAGNGKLIPSEDLSTHSAKLVENLADSGYISKEKLDKVNNSERNRISFEDLPDIGCREAGCDIDLDEDWNDTHWCQEGEQGSNSKVNEAIEASRYENHPEAREGTLDEGSNTYRGWIRDARAAKSKPVTAAQPKPNHNQMTINDI